MDSAVEIRERKKTQEPVSATEKNSRDCSLEIRDRWKSEERKETSAETDGGHFQAEKNDVSTNRKNGKQKV